MKFRLRPELDPIETRMHSNVSKLNVFALINLKLFLKIKATPPPFFISLLKWYIENPFSPSSAVILLFCVVNQVSVIFNSLLKIKYSI